jgi:hypothetical protein
MEQQGIPTSIVILFSAVIVAAILVVGIIVNVVLSA